MAFFSGAGGRSVSLPDFARRTDTQIDGSFWIRIIIQKLFA
jgi:hypothetical protein